MTRQRHTTQSHGKRPQSLGGQLAIGQQLGRYQVLAELASGGMAVVHVASAQGAAGFERLVALKVLHTHLACEEEFIKMFLDEARLAAGIRHPNVVSTMDISDSLEAGYFLVMEYVEGDHLGALLSAAHKRGERLPLPVVSRIVIDALAGLGAAHELRDATGKPLQLVHRDVSPHNVMVGCDGVSRLTDFGVAKAEDRLTQTRHGEVKGKLSYMAPEQASSGTSDRRSDLFSVGIMLWEAVTGRRLFRGETVSATLNKLLSNKIAPPSAIDPALAPLDALLRKALAHDPADRFNTAEEFSDALDLTAQSLGGVASWRTVAEAVNEYASEKLTRERKLIAAAKMVLQARVTTGELPIEPGESGPRTQGGTLSLEAVGGTRAEPSGVFSNVTAPGRRVRNTRSGENPAPPPPPPGTPSKRAGSRSVEMSAAAAAHQLNKSATPPPVPRAARSRSSLEVPGPRAQLRKAVVMGTGAALLLGGWLFWSTQTPPAPGALNPLAGGEIGAPLRGTAELPPDTGAHLVAQSPPAAAGSPELAEAVVWPPKVEKPGAERELRTAPVTMPVRSSASRTRPTRPRAVAAPSRAKPRPRPRGATATSSPRPLWPNPYTQ